jgi:hypothetical protein
MDDGDCPFLRPARSITTSQPPHPDAAVVGMYCALPGRRVRVPNRVELAMFCQPGRFEDCPSYHRYARAR